MPRLPKAPKLDFGPSDPRISAAFRRFLRDQRRRERAERRAAPESSPEPERERDACPTPLESLKRAWSQACEHDKAEFISWSGLWDCPGRPVRSEGGADG
jgi:hypothetical protein